MLTERTCREINLDIGRRLPAVDRSRDRWIIDRYLEAASEGCCYVQHVRATRASDGIKYFSINVLSISNQIVFGYFSFRIRVRTKFDQFLETFQITLTPYERYCVQGEELDVPLIFLLEIFEEIKEDGK